MPITARTRPTGSTGPRLWRVLELAIVYVLAARRQKAAGPAPVLQRSTKGAEPRRAGKAPEARDAQSDSGSEAESKAEAEKDRGRAADKPTEIPSKGWKDIVWRMNQDRILAVAAGVTYFGLLALFPAITALVSLYGLFADAATINDHLTAVSGFLPGGALDVIGEQVKRITAQGGGTLGFAFIFGLALSSGARTPV